jgi:hypothetical protein
MELAVEGRKKAVGNEVRKGNQRPNCAGLC